jgi:hypothetical protein
MKKREGGRQDQSFTIQSAAMSTPADLSSGDRLIASAGNNWGAVASEVFDAYNYVMSPSHGTYAKRMQEVNQMDSAIRETGGEPIDVGHALSNLSLYAFYLEAKERVVAKNLFKYNVTAHSASYRPMFLFCMMFMSRMRHHGTLLDRQLLEAYVAWGVLGTDLAFSPPINAQSIAAWTFQLKTQQVPESVAHVRAVCRMHVENASAELTKRFGGDINDHLLAGLAIDFSDAAMGTYPLRGIDIGPVMKQEVAHFRQRQAEAREAAEQQRAQARQVSRTRHDGPDLDMSRRGRYVGPMFREDYEDEAIAAAQQAYRVTDWAPGMSEEDVPPPPKIVRDFWERQKTKPNRPVYSSAYVKRVIDDAEDRSYSVRYSPASLVAAYGREETFHRGQIRQFARAAWFEMSNALLREVFPPKFRTGSNKALIYHEVVQPFQPSAAQLHFSRYVVPAFNPTDLDMLPGPKHFNTQSLFEFIHTQDVYTYPEPPADEIHFYVNFADTNLFGYYNESEFAQDEIQALEHPVLGSIREFLVEAQFQAGKELLIPMTRGLDGRITPCIVIGAQRQLEIDTTHIYGRNFAPAKYDDKFKSYFKVVPSSASPTNLICIASLREGVGKYSVSDIATTFVTAYAGFAAAVNAAALVVPMKKVVIHTGNWGCGAFGNDVELMTILQITAARLVGGVKKMHYHSVSAASAAKVLNAQGWVKYNMQDKAPVAQYLRALHARGIEWGEGNGT